MDKATNTEVKLMVTTAKMTTFKCLYVELGDKDGDKKLYTLAKARESKVQDLYQVK